MGTTALFFVADPVDHAPTDTMQTWPAAEWPKRIGNGNSTVRIYRIENRREDGVYVEFRLIYRDADRKVCWESFTDYENAECRAVTIFRSAN